MMHLPTPLPTLMVQGWGALAAQGWVHRMVCCLLKVVKPTAGTGSAEMQNLPAGAGVVNPRHAALA